MKHLYVSTACQHSEHGECRRVCKFCSEHCLCRCHETTTMKAKVG